MGMQTIVGRLVGSGQPRFDPLEGAMNALAGIGVKPPGHRSIRGPRGGRPVKARELWWLETRDPTIVGRFRMLYRTRTGRLPAAIPRGARGWVVVLRADVEPWRNGLGAYIRRVVSCQVTEHTDLADSVR